MLLPRAGRGRRRRRRHAGAAAEAGAAILRKATPGDTRRRWPRCRRPGCEAAAPGCWGCRAAGRGILCPAASPQGGTWGCGAACETAADRVVCAAVALHPAAGDRSCRGAQGGGVDGRGKQPLLLGAAGSAQTRPRARPAAPVPPSARARRPTNARCRCRCRRLHLHR
jgi:hypothetical protein